MDAQELERRRRVWRALTEVFLDTETRWFFPWIAGELLASGYTREELGAIWRREMVPVYASNLFQVAGEWEGLAVDEPALLRRASRRPGILAWLAARFLSGQWKRILELRALLERAPEDLRPRLVGAWTAFAHAYLERSIDPAVLDEESVTGLRACGLTREQCEASFAEDFRPIYSKLLLGDERKSE